MGFKEINEETVIKWSRNYLSALWMVMLLVFLASEFKLQANGGALGDYEQWTAVMLPAAIQLAALGAAEYWFRRTLRHFHYCILLVTALLCGFIVSLFKDIALIQALWLLPLLSAVLYFNRRLVVLATGVALAGYSLSVFLHPALQREAAGGGWAAMPCLLIVAALLLISALKRGAELLERLHGEAEDKKSLLIEKAIMDKKLHTDSLTGLYNRAAANVHLDTLLTYAESADCLLHVAIIDVDHFKRVNDTYGHLSGDRVLQRMARLLKDGMGASDFTARYGGEEFLIVAVDQPFADVVRKLDRLRRTVMASGSAASEDLPVTISAGAASYRKGMTRDQLLEQADARLYEAKRSGRNRICI